MSSVLFVFQLFVFELFVFELFVFQGRVTPLEDTY
jgi:hypothetical protein